MVESMIGKLREIVGDDYVINDPEKKAAYFYDEIELTVRPKANEASILVKPATPEEVSELLRLAAKTKTPVVVRGGGTGLSGAAIPIYESVIISMERMNRILEIDEKNMIAVLECGVTLFSLLEELDKYDGIGFPVHPGDEGVQMGGMAVMNAGGARAVRHGVTRKHITGLEVVLPTGEILMLGGKLIKDNAGYSLLDLIIGSEGTLAVVTKVYLKLYPEEHHTGTIIASFDHFDHASKAVIDLLKSGVTPLAVEYQDKHLFTEAAKMLGQKWQLEKGEADLMIILSEKTEDGFYGACRKIQDLCKENGALEMLFAGKKTEQAELLHIRGQHYEYIKHVIGHSFDMAVPVGDIPAFLKELKALVKDYDTVTNVTAHIADGNIHNDIVLVDGKMPPYAEELKNKMYALCFKYGGTITGEHGIGKLRVQDLKQMKSEAELRIMRSIKEAFDPDGILNPGTVLEANERGKPD